ncbi:MAG: hypothetical protein WCK27_11040 [Verrucomicrobiota bacterium]
MTINPISTTQDSPQPAVACTGLLACAWQEHDDGRYDTGCENAFEFTWGTPQDNDFKFCPFCGKAVTTVQANARGQAQPPGTDVNDRNNI